MKTPLRLFVTSLILFGASPGRALSVIPPPDIHHTALHVAAEKGDTAALRQAIGALRRRERDTELNRIDREGYSPLAYAARAGNLEAVEILVKAGATVDRADDYGGWTPLLQAADQRHAAVVRYLVAHGANPNVSTRIGKTPLSVALQGSVFTFGPAGDREATVRALLVGGADPALLLQGFDHSRTVTTEPDAERRQMLETIRQLEAECRELKEILARIRAQAGDNVPRPTGDGPR